MGFTSEGKIVIPMEEFWEFVGKYVPEGVEIGYGVPHISEDGFDMEIDFAMSTGCHPSDLAVKPECLNQWDELRARRALK